METLKFALKQARYNQVVETLLKLQSNKILKGCAEESVAILSNLSNTEPSDDTPYIAVSDPSKVIQGLLRLMGDSYLIPHKWFEEKR